MVNVAAKLDVVHLKRGIRSCAAKSGVCTTHRVVRTLLSLTPERATISESEIGEAGGGS
jgi:hypothetical protein